MPPADIGYRALAANLSDLAAMGARPVLSTVVLGMPPAFPYEDVLEMYTGMLELAAQWRCTIAGGDLVRSPVLLLSITAIGEARANRVKGRGGARPGDIAAVTGALGASRAGLHASRNGGMPEALLSQALAAHRRPYPRIEEGAWLAASDHVHAMMDISDGLSTDLARMCTASGSGALLENVPVAASAAAMAELRGEDPQEYALAGGEDFELLTAIAPRAFRYLNGRFLKRFGKPLLPVGRFDAASGVRMLRTAGEERLTPTGWDHFA